MKRASLSVVFSVWALGFDGPSLRFLSRRLYIQSLFIFFLVLLSSGVCHSLTIHSQVEGRVLVADYEYSSYNLITISPKSAITWICTFVYKFSN